MTFIPLIRNQICACICRMLTKTLAKLERSGGCLESVKLENKDLIMNTPIHAYANVNYLRVRYLRAIVYWLLSENFSFWVLIKNVLTGKKSKDRVNVFSICFFLLHSTVKLPFIYCWSFLVIVNYIKNINIAC